MSGSLFTVWTVGANTFREAVRQRFFVFLIILALGLVGSAFLFMRFDFGNETLKFVADFGFGAILLFGTILSVVMASQLLFSEIDNRTALTMLAKPVRRWEFMVGKWVGLMLLLGVFCLAMFLILAVMLYLQEASLRALAQEQIGMGRLLPSESPFADGGGLVSYGGLALFAVLQWLRLCLLAAITLFIGSFAGTSLYTVVVSFFVTLICQLQYIATGATDETTHPLIAAFVFAFTRVFPNLQLFNVGDPLVFPSRATEPLGWAPLEIAGVALLYTLASLGLAVYAFRKREI
ncbi:MAG: ABC transporter permease [Opitutales bacterium]